MERINVEQVRGDKRLGGPEIGRSEPLGAAALCSASRQGGRWYVLQSLRGREKFARENLQRQGVETYLPFFKKPARRGRAVIERVTAFFPGYLFIRLHAASPLWRSVRGTYGVCRVVGFGEGPVAAPVGLVEHLLERTSSDGLLGFADDIRPGEGVRIVGGAFDSLCGRLLALEPAERVVVLLQVMGREVPVRMARSSIMREQAE